MSLPLLTDGLLPNFCGPIVALLVHICFRYPDSQRPNSRDNAHAFSHRNRTARVQDIKQMRTLQAEVVGTEQRKSFLVAPKAIGLLFIFVFVSAQCGIFLEQCFTFTLAQLEMFPGFLNIRHFEIVNRKLHLIRKPHIAIGPLSGSRAHTIS